MAKKPIGKRFEEEDIKRWQKCSDLDGRKSLNNWMEYVLNKAADKVLGVRKKQTGSNGA